MPTCLHSTDQCNDSRRPTLLNSNCPVHGTCSWNWNDSCLMALLLFGWQYMAPISKRLTFEFYKSIHLIHLLRLNKKLSLWCADSVLTGDPLRYCKAFQDISNIEMFHLIAIHCTYIFHYAQNRVCNGPDGNFIRTLVLSDLRTTECRPLQRLSCHHPTNNNWNMYIMYSLFTRTEQPLTRSQLTSYNFSVSSTTLLSSILCVCEQQSEQLPTK